MANSIGLYLGEFEIQNLIATGRLTSCEPKLRIDGIDSSFIKNRMRSVGKVFDVADEDGNIKTKAKLADSFITTFGNPDPKMVSGLGFGSDVQACKEQYSAFWKENFPEVSLTDSTELFVSIWEHVQ
ncbi:MAG: hypothetical protein K0R29_520 [Pseudobdellovibrio sp.]|nr:hypothetical protein [Pseudobdellovibrio sp.]